MVEPHSSNFRVITPNVLGVQIFRKFTVNTGTPEIIAVIILKFKQGGFSIQQLPDVGGIVNHVDSDLTAVSDQCLHCLVIPFCCKI